MSRHPEHVHGIWKSFPLSSYPEIALHKSDSTPHILRCPRSSILWLMQSLRQFSLSLPEGPPKTCHLSQQSGNTLETCASILLIRIRFVCVYCISFADK